MNSHVFHPKRPASWPAGPRLPHILQIRDLSAFVSSGDLLHKVYDATPAGAYTPATPRITNISARVQVGTGANILIAGFAMRA